MKKPVVTATFIILFVIAAIMLSVTNRDKQHLKEMHKLLILKNDSLHIQHLEAKQELLIMTKKLDSMEQKLASTFKK